MKHIKKVKPQPEQQPSSNADGSEKSSLNASADKGQRRPILYARPCIPVDGN